MEPTEIASRVRNLVAVALIAFTVDSTEATVIDFELGFVDQQPLLLPVLTEDGNLVTFSVGNNGNIAGPAFIARRGNPQTAFQPQDLPAGGSAGSYFLTDENIIGQAARSLDYLITFDSPVSDLSVDLIDFRADGGGKIGDTAFLTVYSDLFGTPVGSASFTVVPFLPDGNVVRLSVPSPSAGIQSAIVRYGSDVGTALDNITFTTPDGRFVLPPLPVPLP